MVMNVQVPERINSHLTSEITMKTTVSQPESDSTKHGIFQHNYAKQMNYHSERTKENFCQVSPS
jgi:hypothetical protein